MTVRAYLDYQPKLGHGVYIDPAAEVIGRVELGDDVSIWPMTVVRGDVHDITIGAGTNVQDGSVLHVTSDNHFNPGGFPLRIGEGVTVGHGAILHACTIGNRCLIGMGATILDGAVLHDRVMVAAGSLVPPGKELEGGYLWMGNPVKRIRPLKDAEAEYLDFSVGHYISLKNDYLTRASS